LNPIDKINRCGVFVADITPINGQHLDSRVTPNPNVLLELGYALATGMGRHRIICILNAAYLPNEDPKELPFDLRGSRPLVFTLKTPEDRGVTKGEKDDDRAAVRTDLAVRIERAVRDAFATVAAERAKRVLSVTPHLHMMEQDFFRWFWRFNRQYRFNQITVSKSHQENSCRGS
jgi:hypothetical protein